MTKGKALAICLAAGLLAIVSSPGSAREAEFTSQAKKCLKCHAKEGIRATYPDGETVSARVSPPAFRTSVHGILDCTGCHPACRAVDPSRRPVPSRSRLRELAASACRSCHSAGQLRAKPIHENLMSREGEAELRLFRLPRENTMTAVSGGKVYSGETLQAVT
jgi:ribosomal protein L40E